MAGNWDPREEQEDLFRSVILSMCDYRQVLLIIYLVSVYCVADGKCWRYLEKQKCKNSIERSGDA